MIIKASTVVALAALVAVAAAGIPAARYPAGVNPAACPNYPYCNPLVDPRGPGYAVGGAYGANPYAYGVQGAYGAWGGLAGYHGAAAYAGVSQNNTVTTSVPYKTTIN